MANIIDVTKSWPLKKQIALLVVVVMSLAGMILLFSWSQRPDYNVLYSNLAESDAGMVIQKLKDMKTPYKIEGGTIFVPSDKVYDLRFQLAAEGIPRGGGVGFELFDKTNFGITDFVQKLNYRRALQGEIERTIMSLSEVVRCRVHLAIPERSLFMREEEKPTASVLLKLMPGRRLSQSQVYGIVHLVSSSVEGLSPDDVTVVDDRGEMLTRPAGETIVLTSKQLEYQRNYEKDMEARTIEILEPVVGKGKVRAKVAAEMDFTQNERTEEVFDPDSAVVRSEQRNIEKSSHPPKGGIPGVASNLPGRMGTTGTQTASPYGQSERKSETINYEISKITKRVISPPATVKRISVAVLVDGVYSSVEGSNKQEYKPRSEEDLAYYEDLVKKAIGFTADRGDEVRVINMPFSVAPEEEMEVVAEKPKDYLPIILTVAKYTVPLIMGILFILFVIRPLIRVLSSPTPPTPPEVAHVPPAVPPREEVARVEKKEPTLIEDVTEWAKKNPREAAELIKGWIAEK